MLDENKLLAVQLIVEGKLPKTEIAEKCGRSRQWLYDFIGTDEFKSEVDRRLQEIRTEGNKMITNNLGKSVENVVYLANNANSEKIRLDASCYLINRSLGMPSVKHDLTIEPKSNESKEKQEFLNMLEDDNIDVDFEEVEIEE